ncbi:glycosyltransferase [Pseudomonadales bacterium]|nr:glycosyltransferase [Pseudomonadales bacterium]
MNIVVITTGLNMGGAETMLLHMVKEWLTKDLKVIVFSLSSNCYLDEKFIALGVEVKNYDIKNFSNFILGLYKLCKDLRAVRPQIVQTWMPHADLVGGIVARLFLSAKIFWGCHHADLSLKTLKYSTLAVVRINAVLSYFVPDSIIAVSKHVETQLLDFGFDKRKLNVIENGIDCSYFKKIENARVKLVDELKISGNPAIIGFVGRYSFEKRPEDFLQLAAMMSKGVDRFHFLMVGDGNDYKNTELLDLIASYKLGGSISLLGVRDDMPLILSSLDVLVSTSVDEAFGLVLIEGLACGCPCVSSNNNGATSIGGRFIRYAETGNIIEFLQETKLVLSQNANERALRGQESAAFVGSKYSIEKTATRYINLYNSTPI